MSAAEGRQRAMGWLEKPALLYPMLGLIGAGGALAFAPFDMHWLAYLSLLPLLWLSWNASPKQALRQALVWTLGQYAAGLYWVSVSMDQFGGLPVWATFGLMALLVGYLAIYTTGAFYLLHRICPKPGVVRYLLVLPPLWLIADLLRGWMLTGFPWLYLGYGQLDTPLQGFAPVLGVQGMTFMVVLLTSALLLGLKQHKGWLAIIPVVLATGMGLDRVQWTQSSGESFKAAIVQGNIDLNEKWKPEALRPTMLSYMELSDQAEGADLIVWPESAIAAIEIEQQGFLTQLDSLMRFKEATLISGVIDYDLTEKEYLNTVIAIGETPLDEPYRLGHSNRYAKHQLLPIGEFVPFEDILRPLAPFFNLPMSAFSRGAYVQPNLETKAGPMSMAICYEIAFPELVRANLEADSKALLTVSNDAWFGTSTGPAQHLQMARMRAVELARPLIRSTNTGMSAIYDHRGDLMAELPVYEAGVVMSEVHSVTGQTPYHRWGQWPLWAVSALMLLAGAALGRRARA